MKKNILYVVAVFVLTFTFHSANAGKGLIMLEEAIESTALRIKMSKDLTGVVTGRVCQTCEVQVLKITPATKLFIGGKPVALKFAAQQSGKPGVAFFDVKTRLVTRIKSYK